MSESETDAYAAAVALLARREHSVRELERKLGAKGASPEAVAAALERLIAERLQSDERYTEAYLRQRSNRGYGPLRIAAELRERGIGDGMIAAELRRAAEEDGLDWYELAVAAYGKKFGGRPIDDIKERAKRQRFLQYRGFEHEQIAAAIGDDWN